MSERELDARNLLCPLPVIRTQNRIASLQPGEVLTIRATDPGALHDIPAWCRIHGHELISAHKEGREVVVVVRAGPRPPR